MNACGAPEEVVLYGRAEANGPLTRLKVVDTHAVWDEEESWAHSYSLDNHTLQYLEIHVKGTAPANHGNCVKMYGLEVYCLDAAARTVDALSLCSDIQTHLCDICTIEALEAHVFNSLLALLRSTGSLGMTIRFIRFLLVRGLESKVNLCAQSSFDSLLLSLDESLTSANEERATQLNTDAKVTFDQDFKSDGAELLENDFVCNTLVMSSSPEYAQLSCKMETGIWEWEFMFTHEIGTTVCCPTMCTS
jgi:hypothetical protein